MALGNVQAPQPEPIERVKIGGKFLTFTASFTRPANTTAYTAGDVVSNSATTTVLMTFGNVAGQGDSDKGVTSNPGGSALLVKGLLYTDLKTETAQYNLTLYTVVAGDGTGNTVIIPADNAPDATYYANAAYDLGTISFPAVSEAADTTNSTGAKGLWTGTPLPVLTLAPDVAIYGKLVNMTGTTPASGQNFTVKLTFLVN